MADTKNTATASPAGVAPVEATDEKFALDSKEVSRVLSVIRYRINEGIRDANRRAPYLSDTQAEARAKALANFRALKEYSEKTF